MQSSDNMYICLQNNTNLGISKEFRGENQITVPHLDGARFDDHNGVIIIKAMPQASDLKMTSYLQTYHPIC